MTFSIAVPLKNQNKTINKLTNWGDQNHFRYYVMDISGYYTFYHDGWPCSLILHCINKNDFEGKLRDFRWAHDFQVIARFRRKDLSVSISVLEFNQMAIQEFKGFVFGNRYHLLAGITRWHSTPFGFFARKGDFLHMPQFGMDSRDVKPQHFLGDYVVWLQKIFFNLQLFTLNENRIVGEIKMEGLEHEIVVGHLQEKFPHYIKMSIPLPSEAVKINGYLSSHSRNAIAGFASFKNCHTGVFMIKTREPAKPFLDK